MINNVYDEVTGNFDGTALTALAKTQGYTNLKAMVAAAEGGTAITGNNFGDFTLKFGSYAHMTTGEKIDLVWQPTYLSQDKDGNAILTLWLASTESANTSSNQEVSWFSDGTQSYRSSGGAPRAFNDEGVTASVESNCYDGSYIRFAMVKGNYLNSDGTWKFANSFGSAIPNNSSHIRYSGTRITPPDESTLTKFDQFYDDGVFGSFIVKPNNVQWQLDESRWKGDLSYAGNGYAAAYTTNWADDTLWLPGKDEVSSGALWNLTSDQLKYPIETWLRTASESGVSTDRYGVHTSDRMQADGQWSGYSGAGHVGSNYCAVRPAFHLNLSQVAEFISETPEVSGTYNYSRQEQTITIDNFDTDRVKITNVQRTDGDGTANVSPTFTETSVKVTDAGEYTITFETKTGTESGKQGQYYFSEVDTTLDSPDTPYKVTKKFTVNKATLLVPNFGAGTANTKTYNGTTQTFTANNYPNETLADTPAWPRDPLSVTFTEKTSGRTVTPTITKTTDGKLEVEIRDAGEYVAKFTIADLANYDWNTGGNDPKDVEFIMKKKTLTVTADADSPNGVWSWAADETYSATLKIEGFIANDRVQMEMDISDSTGTSTVAPEKNADGTEYTFTIDADAFGGAYILGTYSVGVSFQGGADDNNYDLETPMKGISPSGKIPFVIGAAGAGLPSYTWRYTEWSGAAGDSQGAFTPMPAGNKLEYKAHVSTGKGTVYSVFVDTSKFADAYIELDDSAYTDDDGNPTPYSNNQASAAGQYTTYVAIKTTDSEHAFADGSNKAVVRFDWEIEKATISATDIKWYYTDANGVQQEYHAGDKLPWKKTNYTLTLSNLPTGVTVNPGGGSYLGNSEKLIGTYTATCTGLKYDTDNYNQIATPTIIWEIVPAPINITNASWKQDEQSGSGSTFYLPHLNSPYDGNGITYEYYDIGANGTETPRLLENGIEDIVAESGVTHWYYVKAVLSTDVSTDGTTAWNQALELVEQRNAADIPDGDFTMRFQTGDNRAPISVSLNGNPVTYDGEPHGKLNESIFIKVGNSDFEPENFDILYFYDRGNSGQEGGTADGKPYDINKLPAGEFPVNAGKYLIVVQLKDTAASDYFLNATTFEFEVLPYTFDMSQVRWGYVDEEGNEVVYNPSFPLRYKLDPETKQPLEQRVQLVGLPKGDENGTEEEQLLAKMF
ncbi:MAG: hypothetical protein K2H43_04480, partial [Clostridia bacterium]|nr:hypothetical protein [Clostridia bacterium]